MLTEDKVQSIFRHALPHEVEEFVQVFNNYATSFRVITEFQINAFLAQIDEETGSRLTPTRENLNYSCDALGVFSYYKRNPNEARQDGRCNGHKADQRKIANKIYGDRLGNNKRNGWLFRGAGYIQITGRDNFETISKNLNKLEHLSDITPETLVTEMSTIEGALLSAMSFYFTHKLYDAKTIDEMTEIINKHTSSYKQRKKLYKFIASL